MLLFHRGWRDGRWRFPKINEDIFLLLQRRNDQGGALTLKYASLCADIFGYKTCDNRDRYSLEFQASFEFPVERAHCTLMPYQRSLSFVAKMSNYRKKKKLVQAKTQISLASQKSTTGP